MKETKFLITASCLIIAVAFTNAQGIKQDVQRKKQQQIEREQSIKAEAERQQRLQAEREEAAQRAEQERQKREERKRLGIPEVTKDNLIENAAYLNYDGHFYVDAEITKEEKERSKGSWGRGGIEFALTLDVYAWNDLKYYGGGYIAPYETELKRKVFEDSEEYKEKLEKLKGYRSRLLQTVLYAKLKHGYGGFEPQYDLNKRAFKVHTHKMRTNPVNKELVNEFIFNTLPVTGDDDSYRTNGTQFFLLKTDEKTAIEIEGNEDVQLYVFFILNGKVKELGFGGSKLYESDKVRIVLAHQKTGKIYYDQSFPEGCLPLAKQETMTTEEYLAYQAEQQRIAEEQKAAERRREMEKIQEERRKEQKRIEAAKRAEEEKIAAAKQQRKEYIEQWCHYYSFDDGGVMKQKDCFTYPAKGGACQVFGKPEFIEDTPDGKGKAIALTDKKQYLSIPKPDSWKNISFWIKDCSSGILWSFTQKPMLNSEKSYDSPYLSYGGASKLYYSYRGTNKNMNGVSAEKYESSLTFDNCILNDGKWHLLTFCRNEKGNSSYIYFYLDGKLTGYSKPLNDWRALPNQQNTVFTIGAPKDGCRMKIDNLHIYHTELAPEDVANIYEEERKK